MVEWFDLFGVLAEYLFVFGWVAEWVVVVGISVDISLGKSVGNKKNIIIDASLP